MFDFLNKLSHNHQPPIPEPEQVLFDQISSSEDEKRLQRSQSQNERYIKSNPSRHNSPKHRETIDRTQKIEKKSIKRGNSIVGKMQIVQKVQLNPVVQSILSGLLVQSAKGVSNVLSQKLHKAKEDRQRRVYVREMARDGGEYMVQASKSIQVQSYFLQLGLQQTVNSIINQISKEIEVTDVPIRMKRKKYQDAEQERKQETLRLIKMRESQLQNKIGELSVELSFGLEAAQRRAHQMLSKQDFDPDSIKTKLAQEFVKEKHREREQKKLKLEEYRDKKRTLEMQAREIQQQKQEQLKMEKHERLVKEFAQKQRMVKEEKQKSKEEEHNYREFLKEYKQVKPLYKIKEEEFQNRVKEEKKERYYALKEKQAKYEPLNMEVLEMHEERYEQLRREDRERKEAELELAKQKQLLLKKQLDEKIYKGKFRYIVLQQMVDVQSKKREKQAEKQAILMKKQAYSLEVKQHYKPTVDPSKRNEIEQIINSHKQRKRKFMTPNRIAYSDHYSTISTSHHPYSQPEIDPKKEGEKYHRLFKQYIRNKIEKGQVKSDEDPNQGLATIIHKPDYLKELREKYEGRIPSKSTRLDRQIEKMKEGQDYRALMLKAQQFQSKAKQRQVKLRNVAHYPSEQAKLQEDYLCAIKAKMELISNMD